MVGIVLSHTFLNYGGNVSLSKTIFYTSFFILGVLLHKNQNQISIIYQQKLNKNLFMLTTVLLLSYHNLLPSIKILHIFFVDNWFQGIGSINVIVMFLCSEKLKKLSENKCLQLNGQISYYVYLVHAPILFIGYALLPTKSSVLLVALCSLPIILLTALIMYHLFQIRKVNI